MGGNVSQATHHQQAPPMVGNVCQATHHKQTIPFYKREGGFFIRNVSSPITQATKEGDSGLLTAMTIHNKTAIDYVKKTIVMKVINC